MGKEDVNEAWLSIGNGTFAAPYLQLRPSINVVLDDGAIMPRREHDTDAGADLFTPKSFTLPAHGEHTVDTGVHIELPRQSCAEVMPKSGLNVKHSIVGWGLVDEGYTGSIHVKLYNLGDKAYRFEAGDKIAQLVVRPVQYPDFFRAARIRGGARGNNGFGSTGRA